MPAQQPHRPSHQVPEFGHDTRRLDQHFLNPLTAAHIVTTACPRADDTVLDIGAGTGAIVAARPRQVIAVEADPRCASRLIALQGSHPAFTVIMRRLRDVDRSALCSTTMIIANPPFSMLEYLTQLIRKLPTLRSATMCVSHRWARSVIAPVGSVEFGRASVAVQSRFDARIIQTIDGDCFTPASPKLVALVQLPRIPEVDPGLDSLAEALLAYGGLRVKDMLRSRRFRHQSTAEQWHSAQHRQAVRGMQQTRLTELTSEQISELAASLRLTNADRPPLVQCSSRPARSGHSPE